MHIESLSIHTTILPQSLAINKSWDGDIPSYLSFDNEEYLLYEEILVWTFDMRNNFSNMFFIEQITKVRVGHEKKYQIKLKVFQEFKVYNQMNVLVDVVHAPIN